MIKWLELFARDKKGAIAVTSALLLTVLIGFAALGVDVGSVYTDRRTAQGVADLAAIAAVSDLANAEKAAGATVARNKLPNATYKLEYGIYAPDAAVAPDKRFTPSDKSVANAARVLLESSTPLLFAKVITGKDQFAVQTKATAALSSFATFAIGSRLLKVDGGLLNQLLGGLLGTSLSLTAMDYEALIALKLDAFDFMNALATKLQITGGTYDSVLSGTVKVGTIVDAMSEAGRQEYGAANTAVRAIDRVAQAMAGKTTKVNVRSLVDLGPYSSMAIGEKPKISAGLSAFEMLTAAGEAANGDNQLALNIDTSIPGIASASLKLAIGERPKGTSWVTFGNTGASVHTAQTRLLLTVKLIGTPPYSAITLPIYVEIASGTATLTSLKCGFPDIGSSTATLAVTPGLVDAWIGDVSGYQFTNFVNAPAPGAATLVDILGLKVTAKGHVSVSNLQPTPVIFTYSDVLNQTKKTVGTTNFTSSLLSRLLTDTQIGVNVLGLGIGMGAPAVTSAISSLLMQVTAPVDQLLSSVLQTLGVGLGQADVWVSGVRCDGAVLVI